MTKSLLLILCFCLISCASDFNANKRIDSEKILGESVYRQEGKIINKFQVFDKIGKTKSDNKDLSELKKDYILATSGAVVGGFLVGSGLFEKNASSKILLGGLLVGLGYYFGLRTDEKLTPYVKKHNKNLKRSSYFPFLLIAPDDKGVATGLGYNLAF
jgi:hypothetical protein